MKLTEIIESSKCCKARLLHYFPQKEETNENNNDEMSFSSWCGWHNDHGSITGLVSAIYMDENGEIVNNNDPDAGLYIRSRKSELVKVAIPSDHIAFHIGETAQVHSGGILQATPHAVRGSKVPNISRETFAVFMEPMWMEPMNTPEGTIVLAG
jgi:isopenicillin N synthase-like dioxygenase